MVLPDPGYILRSENNFDGEVGGMVSRLLQAHIKNWELSKDEKRGSVSMLYIPYHSENKINYNRRIIVDNNYTM